ncbi:predicted protein [Histoplasma capsulatum var. duboisii H88]|uniref:Predicted protein n=2 Tax=Ajellomyces capsulatus TaxID=5037 RepID=F0UGF3_AJEC8|nr:predicted protein [Histoplasma capsulatum H143]EGC44306.1 predicted protein [Histoplasma capsulatum var. duboisii H88]
MYATDVSSRSEYFVLRVQSGASGMSSRNPVERSASLSLGSTIRGNRASRCSMSTCNSRGFNVAEISPHFSTDVRQTHGSSSAQRKGFLFPITSSPLTIKRPTQVEETPYFTKSKAHRHHTSTV